MASIGTTKMTTTSPTTTLSTPLTTPLATPFTTSQRHVRLWNPSYYDFAPPPESCYTLGGAGGPERLASIAVWGMGCKANMEDPDVACHPWAQSDLTGSTFDFNPYGFWSPATKCPSGWVSMTTITTMTDVKYGFQDGETGIRCCPNGFTVSSNVRSETCYPSATAASDVVVRFCDSGSTTLTTWSNIPPTGYLDQWTVIMASPLELRYQASDLSATVTPPPNSSTPRTRSPDEPINTQQPPQSGSTGKPIGRPGTIVIGLLIPLVVLVGLGLVFSFWRKRQAKRQAKLKTTPDQCRGRDDDKEVAGIDTFESIRPELEGSSGISRTGVQDIEYRKPELDATETAIRPNDRLHANGTLQSNEGIGYGSTSTHNVGNMNGPRIELPTSSTPAPKPTPIMASPTPQQKWPSSVMPEPGTSLSGVQDTPIELPIASSPTSELEASDTLAALLARRARIAEEQKELERLRRLREEARMVEEEIARVNKNKL